MRLEVVADFRDELWPSMDLAADMLVQAADRLPNVECHLLRPRMWRGRRDGLPASMLERACGRFVQYPLEVLRRGRAGRCFHVVDHSYAHLVHALPRRRTGVYCHDIDAFRALLPPTAERASRRVLSTVLLSGMRRAAVVFYSTAAVRDEILAHQLLGPERLVHAPFGIAPEFDATPTAADEAIRARHPLPFLLNVGSCIPRKNVPFLLRLFAVLRQRWTSLQLVQIGGAFDAEQRALLRDLDLEGAVVQRRDLLRTELAAYYRQARIVVQPTLAEGFGLPLTEAMACGAAVVASALPVLREVGGAGVGFVAVGDLAAWERAVSALLGGEAVHDQAASVREAARFSWSAHARTIVDAYRELLVAA